MPQPWHSSKRSLLRSLMSLSRRLGLTGRLTDISFVGQLGHVIYVASQKNMGIWIGWLFKKTNSIAGEVEGATPRRMWWYLKEKAGQGPRSEELWWSNQSCRQREGTSFKACFIESHKKWSGWIVPLGNQLEDLDINLSSLLEVNKHVWLSVYWEHFRSANTLTLQ